ncbi:MAG TPA: hypothetical protein PK387_02990 [Mesotoga prima]|uniref:alpha/beta hydrolase n=1 Tax=Mesotoga prima TaxID=1184387 RepID=UPI002CC8B189|nr:hypothetical protein [Mesotoga prima]HPQ90915.1 hypothetical protein [Mesotoga prima]
MKTKGGYSTIVAIFGILMGVIAILNYLFPLNHMPLPDGPHNVGFRSYEVSNPQPMSVAGIDYSDPGKIRLEVWYPAGDVSTAPRKGWIDNDPLVFQGFEIMTGYPEELFEHIYRVKTNSFIDAPPVDDSSTWPIIILLLGWSSISELHTSLAESLASAGYLVVGIEHPGACAVVSFSNGDVHYFLGNDLLERLPEGTRESKVRMLSEYLARDINYAIEYLNGMNEDPSSDFFERLNMNEIGLYGHSGGGAVAIQYALANKNVPMVLADPTLEGFSVQELDTAFSNKILLMSTEEWEHGISEEYSSTIAKERNESFYNLRICGMRHVDFAMVRNLSPLTFFFGETGRFMNDEDAIGYLDSAVKLFFDSVFFGGEIEELFALSESVPEFSM